MFCMNCGAKLPDGAAFCSSCGAKLGGAPSTPMPSTGTKFVPAKCTNCGGQLDVDPTMQAAVCPYCNTAFVVEQAINNFNVTMNGGINIGSAVVNVNGVSVDNLLERAKQFEAEGKLESAKQYYNKVLDCDISNAIAKQGVARTEDLMNNYVFFQAEHKNLFSANQIVQAKIDRLDLYNKNGVVDKTYYYMNMKNVKTGGFNTSVQFDYPGSFGAVVLGLSPHCQDVVNLILCVQMGKGPKFE